MKSAITIPDLQAKKQCGERITMLTCYDYAFGRIVDQCDIDVVLVGDSLGMVVQGEETTLPVTIEEMIYHTRIVKRGVRHSLLVTDMPFLSYQASEDEAVANAGRLLKEGGAQAVKLEGGTELVPLIARLVNIGVPVFGHIGLQPQSIHAMGGYRVQGKSEEAAAQLQRDALALEDAGIAALVLEGIPSEVAAQISAAVRIPTIGIGSGVACDGQVLVIHDLLGMDESFRPRFVRRYASLEKTIRDAVDAYAKDVKSGHFPSKDESFHRDKKDISRKKKES